MYILYFCFVKIISSILFPELLFVMYFNLVLCSVVTTTYVLIYVLYAPCKSSLWLNGSLNFLILILKCIAQHCTAGVLIVHQTQEC